MVKNNLLPQNLLQTTSTQNSIAPTFNGLSSSWKKVTLQDVVTLQRGFDLPVDQREEGPYPVIGSNGIVGYHSNFKVNGPGVLVGRSGSVGKVTWTNEHHWPLNTTLWVTDFHGNDPKFVFYFLCYLDLGKYTEGVSVPTLNRNIIHPLTVSVPCPPEQRAIAHVLQTVQQAIQTRRKELELERERKAALMQHLFTHGTRNEPTKQSEVGEIPESWEIRKLGEVLQNAQYGISLAGKLSGTYPILRMNNLIDGVISYDNLQYVDIDKRTLALFQLNRGDILFNRTNSADLVGKTALFDEDNPTVFASYLIRITTDKERLLPDFLNWYFNWQVIQKRLQSIATRGVSQANISASNLQNFKILIPPLLTEQEEIAKIFNLHTAKIAILEKEITLHEELFRALLDELMTGRISTLPLVEQLEKGTSSDGQRTPDGTGTID